MSLVENNQYEPGRGFKGRGVPFAKGISPNPGGRPAGFDDVANAARKLGMDAIATLAELMANPKSKDATRLRAAELILERGFGKAPAFKTSDPEGFRDVLQLSDEQIKQRLATIRGLLLEHGIDPLRKLGQEGAENKPGTADGG